MGFLAPWFLAGVGGCRPAGLAAPAQEASHHSSAVQFAHVLRASHAKLHQAPPPAVSAAARAAHCCSCLLALAFAAPFIRTAPAGGDPGPQARWCWPSTIRSACVRATGCNAPRKRPPRAWQIASRGPRAGDGVRRRSTHDERRHASDVTSLRAGIRAIQPTDDRGSVAELSHALTSLAQSAGMPVEAHLFSDMQKSSHAVEFCRPRGWLKGYVLVPHPVAGGPTCTRRKR